jgi:hypothetical protein
VAPTVVSDPALMAVFGATQSGAGILRQATDPVPAPAPAPPPLRRVTAMAAPGAASLLLVAHFVYTADYGGAATRTYRPYGAYVIANWGELAMACVMVMVGCLAIGTVLGTLTASMDRSTFTARPLSPAAQVGTGILVAAALGAAIAGLYAVLVTVYLGIPATSPLRWTLLPIAPVALLAAVAAGLAARSRRYPVQGWDGFLAFPITSVLAGTIGMVLVQQAMKTPSAGVMGRFGGLLIGFGAAAALVSPWVLRLIVGLPLGVVLAAIVSWRATGILAVIFTVAVTLWWAGRLWALLRSPATEPAAMPVAPPAGAWRSG